MHGLTVDGHRVRCEVDPDALAPVLRRLVDLFLAAMLGLFGMGAAGYAIAVVGRLRVEETSGRVEPVLAVGLTLFGALLRLPSAVRDLSPFSHLPSLPGGQVSAVPLVVLVLLAAGFAAAGLVGLRRRDLPVG